MYRYLALNLVVVVVVLAGLIVWTRRFLSGHRTELLLTMGVLAVMTIIGDNVILRLGLVHYNEAHILGLRIGRAPIEDFMYVIVSVLVPVVIWTKGKYED